MSVRKATLRLVPLGSVVLFLFFLTGIWVTMSPFAMTTQPSGQPWIASTINNVTLGAILMAVSLFGILAYLALALRDLLRETPAKQEADQQSASG
jgi:cytochrome c oxidase assembly factor CtaG